MLIFASAKREGFLHLYIDIYRLPIVDIGLEAAAVDDRFGQRKSVQNDMYVAPDPARSRM